MKRVLVVGGGISGLLTAYTLSKRAGVEVKVMEPGKPGGEFLAGGLKYIHKTAPFQDLLEELNLPWSEHPVKGGILLRGTVQPYPRVLSAMGSLMAQRVRYDHYKKTRRQEPDSFASKAMNDPEANGPSKALRTDFQALISSLASKVEFINARLDRVQPKFVTSRAGATYWYDYLVLTIPIWIVKDAAEHFDIPDALAMNLNIVNVDVVKDAYASWDYVYTPYTPADAIHRFSPHEGGYTCEINGKLDQNKMVSDLNFLFSNGWSVSALRENLKGHLLPLERPVSHPANVALVGRFAKWDPRATADVVLDEAIALRKEWLQ